jgi:hypothetical protein
VFVRVGELARGQGTAWVLELAFMFHSGGSGKSVIMPFQKVLNQFHDEFPALPQLVQLGIVDAPQMQGIDGADVDEEPENCMPPLDGP